jgi:hypothetical protein
MWSMMLGVRSESQHSPSRPFTAGPQMSEKESRTALGRVRLSHFGAHYHRLHAEFTGQSPAT